LFSSTSENSASTTSSLAVSGVSAPGEAAEAKNNAESLIHTTERQLAEHGDKVDASVKSEIETALADAKAAVEGGDADQMSEKTQTLAQAAMKLGQAIYEKEQAAAASPGAETPETANDDVVDAEFSEVDENKG
jgi:molecular chaperone DnaK